jgi:hypothetical protein
MNAKSEFWAALHRLARELEKEGQDIDKQSTAVVEQMEAMPPGVVLAFIEDLEIIGAAVATILDRDLPTSKGDAGTDQKDKAVRSWLALPSRGFDREWQMLSSLGLVRRFVRPAAMERLVVMVESTMDRVFEAIILPLMMNLSETASGNTYIFGRCAPA